MKRLLLSGLVFAAAVSAAPAQALTLTQTIQFDEILPFGTYSDGDFTVGGWNALWPFTQASEITAIRFIFESDDEDWLDHEGPLGERPYVEINVLDDALNRIGVASTTHGLGPIHLGPAQDPLFSTVRDLLVDGAITARLGGFEDHGDHSESFTFLGTSWLTLEVDGTPGDVNPVPEPGTWALLAGGAAGALLARRRSRG
jgi:hypothetical protein